MVNWDTSKKEPVKVVVPHSIDLMKPFTVSQNKILKCTLAF